MLFPGPRRGASAGLLALLGILPQLAKADCECGYRVTIPSNGTNSNTTNTLTGSDSSIPQQYIVTDLIETNFANISDVSKNTDWIRQAFNKTAQQSLGTYGEMMAVDNIESVVGTGLEITLRGEADLVEGMVQGGEIDTARTDLLYGTFRSSMKLTDVSGTVSAFFFYFNDSQEIDMEFLSREFSTDNATYPVNLVLQSEASEAASSASHTSTFAVINLPFDPRADFHEYRFDWFPDRVVFIADGAVLAQMNQTSGVPTHAGHLVFNHWSNGNAGWSGGPPTTDAVMAVQYLKAYFNSSDEARQRAFAARCGGGDAAGAICDIPNVTPDNNTAAGWFFSGQKNMTANQTVSTDSGITGGDTNGAAARDQGGVVAAWLATGLTSIVVILLFQF